MDMSIKFKVASLLIIVIIILLILESLTCWAARFEYSYKVRNNEVCERTIPRKLLFLIN